MTTEQQRQDVLQGKNEIVNEIMAFLAEQGWAVDRIIKSVTSKIYKPNKATIWVTFDSVHDMYWIKPEYTSKGENVLSLCNIMVKGSESKEERKAKLKAFISKVENEINGSFAVRFLRN